MITTIANYEVKGGKLLLNGEGVPLRTGVVDAALARAGRKGYEGPVSGDLALKVLHLDRRVSLLALAREIETSAA
jgi:hypothetical protein